MKGRLENSSRKFRLPGANGPRKVADDAEQCFTALWFQADSPQTRGSDSGLLSGLLVHEGVRFQPKRLTNGLSARQEHPRGMSKGSERTRLEQHDQSLAGRVGFDQFPE
jgi:hypothetical protein